MIAAFLYTACKLSSSCSFFGEDCNSHQLSSMTKDLGETETFFKIYLETRDHSVLLGYCKCLQRPERVLMQCPMVGVSSQTQQKPSLCRIPSYTTLGALCSHG